MYAVSKQPLALPVTGTDLLPIEAVTVPPQSKFPCADTSNPQPTGEFRVIVGFVLKNLSPVIEVAIFPDAGGDAVGVGDDVRVGDALALGDGETLAVLTADVVVADAVVEEVEVFVLATCGLVGVDEVQPATRIVAITVATTSKERRLFLMLVAQITQYAARI